MGSRVSAAVVVLAWMAMPAAASELLYRPVNPAFGGSPLNSSYLQFTAQAQRRQSSSGSSASGESDLAQQFVRQLQSRLLSSLATEVSNAIFGENAQDSGRIVFGDQVISFERGLEAVILVIENEVTGQSTTISVPVFISGGG